MPSERETSNSSSIRTGSRPCSAALALLSSRSPRLIRISGTGVGGIALQPPYLGQQRIAGPAAGVGDDDRQAPSRGQKLLERRGGRRRGPGARTRWRDRQAGVRGARRPLHLEGLHLGQQAAVLAHQLEREGEVEDRQRDREPGADADCSGRVQIPNPSDPAGPRFAEPNERNGPGEQGQDDVARGCPAGDPARTQRTEAIAVDRPTADQERETSAVKTASSRAAPTAAQAAVAAGSRAAAIANSTTGSARPSGRCMRSGTPNSASVSRVRPWSISLPAAATANTTARPSRRRRRIIRLPPSRLAS